MNMNILIFEKFKVQIKRKIIVNVLNLNVVNLFFKFIIKQ